jgi:hypothetical protein
MFFLMKDVKTMRFMKNQEIQPMEVFVFFIRALSGRIRSRATHQILFFDRIFRAAK